MIAMLNPQPLPPRSPPPVVRDATTIIIIKPSPVAPPRTCPTCTSGVFPMWGSSVAEWTVPASV